MYSFTTTAAQCWQTSVSRPSQADAITYVPRRRRRRLGLLVSWPQNSSLSTHPAIPTPKERHIRTCTHLDVWLSRFTRSDRRFTRSATTGPLSWPSPATSARVDLLERSVSASRCPTRCGTGSPDAGPEKPRQATRRGRTWRTCRTILRSCCPLSCA